jgi:hypothetical protein
MRAALAVAVVVAGWSCHFNGTTAKTPSSSPWTPSSRHRRSSSNQSRTGTDSPRACAHSRQVWVSVPMSIVTGWYAKLLYLNVLCQNLMPRTRNWSVWSASSVEPSAARTSAETSPVSRVRSEWWAVS